MTICKVIGNVWATKKDENLSGYKLMIVRKESFCGSKEPSFVAADIVGAGIGEQVLVVSGSTARKSLGRDSIPIDAVIVGIIDSLEIDQGQ